MRLMRQDLMRQCDAKCLVISQSSDQLTALRAFFSEKRGEEDEEQNAEQAANAVCYSIHYVFAAPERDEVALQAFYEPAKGYADDKYQCKMAEFSFREAAKPKEGESAEEYKMCPFVYERNIDLRQVFAGHKA